MNSKIEETLKEAAEVLFQAVTQNVPGKTTYSHDILQNNQRTSTSAIKFRCVIAAVNWSVQYDMKMCGQIRNGSLSNRILPLDCVINATKKYFI